MTRAFATRKDHTVVTLDLVMKRANSEDPFVRNSMDWAVATPSEMFLLTAGGSAPVIHRYDINGRFQHDETGPVAPDGFLVGGVSLSGDGQYVCLSGGVVNLDVPHPRPDAGRSETKIYAVRDLKKPAFVLRADAPLRGVAFDPERKKIYSTDGPNLLVFDDKGELTKTYPRAPDSQNTTACLFNPVRRQVLLTGADRFSLVAWRP
jgi:hypothetical protein